MANSKDIGVICPVCNDKQVLGVPKDIIENNVKGVTTIAVNAPCGHSFHIFVDKNFAVRGYQRSDFDIKLDVPSAVEKVPIQDLSLQAIIRTFGEESFLLAIIAVLMGKKCVLYGRDQQILKSLFINFIEIFEKEKMRTSAESLEIISKDEYDSLEEGAFRDSLVIDIDFSIVKNNPLANVKTKILGEILKESLSLKDPTRQKAHFKGRMERIFRYMDDIRSSFMNWSLKELKKHYKQQEKELSQKELAFAYEILHA